VSVPDNTSTGEERGRGVFSSRHAKRAERSRVPLNVFLVEAGKTEISVDRLTFAGLERSTAIADKTAVARNAKFYGWAVVTAEQASDNGRYVIATPRPEHDNPYHADIVLPELTSEDREEQKRHAQELC